MYWHSDLITKLEIIDAIAHENRLHFWIISNAAKLDISKAITQEN